MCTSDILCECLEVRPPTMPTEYDASLNQQSAVALTTTTTTEVFDQPESPQEEAIEPERLLQWWLGAIIQPENTSEENWRERMLRWRVGVFARNFEDMEFVNMQRYVLRSMFKAGGVASFFRSSKWYTPRGALAQLIVLDQFSRCVYRGTPLAFRYDNLTRELVLEIIRQKWDTEVYNVTERMWVYVCLSHHEDLAVQDLSVDKWTQWSRDLVHCAAEQALINRRVGWYFVKSIIEHSEAVLQFGRFPHRNEILGRETTDAEQKYLDSPYRPLWSLTQKPSTAFATIERAASSASQASTATGSPCDELEDLSLELEDLPSSDKSFSSLDKELLHGHDSSSFPSDNGIQPPRDTDLGVKEDFPPARVHEVNQAMIPRESPQQSPRSARLRTIIKEQEGKLLQAANAQVVEVFELFMCDGQLPESLASLQIEH